MRRATFLACLVLACVLTPSALAKSYRLTFANEQFAVQRDGTVRVNEQLTFAFAGAFHGVYRLIPAIGGQSISAISLSENGVPYTPGADAAVGSAGDPGTFGVTTTPEGWTQVTWHIAAQNETRTFDLAYTLGGYVDTYSDIGNLYLQVWGAQWPVALDRLHSEIALPAPVPSSEKSLLRAWGHPRRCRGT